MTLASLLALPYVKGGLAGLGVAVWVDVELFLRDGSWASFLKDWSWKVATYRYVRGILVGAFGLTAYNAAS